MHSDPGYRLPSRKEAALVRSTDSPCSEVWNLSVNLIGTSRLTLIRRSPTLRTRKIRPCFLCPVSSTFFLVLYLVLDHLLGRQYLKIVWSDLYSSVGLANSYFLVPFVVTIVAALLFSCYMLLDPAVCIASFMQLTYMAVDFRLFILILGCGYFLIAWTGEKYVLPRFAKVLGLAKESLGRFPKRRKSYKVIQGSMRV